MKTPYICGPNGESLTRNFVESFLDSYSNRPEEKIIGKTYSGDPIYDRLFGISPAVQSTLYQEKAADSLTHYIGRAPRVASGGNANEFLWCLCADISKATKKLDDRTRKVLGLRYVCDYSDETIADMLKISVSTVLKVASKGLDKLTVLLDQS